MVVNVRSGNWKQLKPLTSNECFRASVLNTLETSHIIFPWSIFNIKKKMAGEGTITSPTHYSGKAGNLTFLRFSIFECMGLHTYLEFFIMDLKKKSVF